MSRSFGGLASILCLVGCAPGESGVRLQHRTDVLEQAANNEVDILWVVDNSQSMAEEQAALAAGFQSFASQLEASGTAFQIGVVTTSFEYTDNERGKLVGDPPFITNDTPEYEAAFAVRATAVGIEGSDKEKGLEVAEWALHPSMTMAGGLNEGFVRPDAQLLIVFVSDEEDCSDGGALEGEPASACYTSKDQLIPPEDFIESFRDLKPNNRALVSTAAIVGSSAGTCPDAVAGDRYLTVAALMGGLMGDICESDWSEMLGDLGLNAQGVITKFRLAEAAVPDSIHVSVEGEEIPESDTNGWTYDEETWFLTFHGDGIPARGSQITVEYDVDPAANQVGAATTSAGTTTP